MAKQGQSPLGTRHKLEGIYDILHLCAKISLGAERKFEKWNYPFWFADLNCGSGWNEQANCYGSPIQFIEAMAEVNRKFCAYFCDKDQNRCETSLQTIVENYNDLTVGSKIRYFWKNNSKLLTKLADWIIDSGENPQYAVGAILSDPNGPSIDGFPLKEIVEFVEQFPRIDVILNVNVTTMKKCRGVKKIEGFIDDWPAKTLREMIQLIPKRYWLIREPVLSKGYYYVILCGRNIRTGDHRKLGFHQVASQTGFQIIQKADSDRKD